jgi:hypothetical protein
LGALVLLGNELTGATKASQRASTAMIWLTVVLVLLTAAIFVLTGVLVSQA